MVESEKSGQNSKKLANVHLFHYHLKLQASYG